MSDNEEILRQLNATIAKINEGSVSVRDQIDNHVLPILEPDYSTAADYVREARHLFTSGDQVAKKEIREAIRAVKEPNGDWDRKRAELHLGWLGIFHDFLVNMWDGTNEAATKQRIGDCLKKGRSYGFPVVDFFTGLSSGKAEHDHLNYKTPWVWLTNKEKFDLATPEARYGHIYREFIKLVYAADLEPCPHLVMGRGYMNFVFKNNIQKTNTIWDERNWKYLVELGLRQMQFTQDVLGPEYHAFMKGVNESGHHGNCDKFHKIMYIHEHFYRFIVAKKSDISKYIVDRTLCEGATAEVVEDHDCAKPACCDRGGRHGDPALARRKLKTESVLPETHGRSVVEDFTDSGGIRLPGSGWWRFKYHEDGGSRTGKGKGVEMRGHKWADAEQSLVYSDYVFSKCVRKGKQGIIAWLPGEVYGVHDGFYGSLYSIDRIGDDGWARAEALQTSHKKYYDKIGDFPAKKNFKIIQIRG